MSRVVEDEQLLPTAAVVHEDRLLLLSYSILYSVTGETVSTVQRLQHDAKALAIFPDGTAWTNDGGDILRGRLGPEGLMELEKVGSSSLSSDFVVALAGGPTDPGEFELYALTYRGEFGRYDGATWTWGQVFDGKTYFFSVMAEWFGKGQLVFHALPSGGGWFRDEHITFFDFDPVDQERVGEDVFILDSDQRVLVDSGRGWSELDAALGIAPITLAARGAGAVLIGAGGGVVEYRGPSSICPPSQRLPELHQAKSVGLGEDVFVFAFDPPGGYRLTPR
jgi:hypothetical protein